jgi:hypothetical protein
MTLTAANVAVEWNHDLGYYYFPLKEDFPNDDMNFKKLK